jgi:hypothetical protein
MEHPLLGTIRAKSSPRRIIQYLGLPYATNPTRFARSEPLNDPLSRDIFDTTIAGPDSFQPENVREIRASGNNFPHDGFKEAAQSETACISTSRPPDLQQTSSIRYS